MADNTRLNAATTVGDDIATLDVAGVKHEKVINEFLDPGGVPIMVSAADPLPVAATISTAGLATETKQDAGNSSLASIDGKLTNPLPVTDSGQQTDALTDTELRATPVPISGTVTANTGLTQPLTDAQLRALAVPVSGTFFQGTQPVSGPLTDVQLRTTPVPVSGTVTVDTSLLATAAKQDTGNTALASILAKIIAAPATEAKQDTQITALGTLATQTTLAAVLAKLSADPATQTTLAAILAKILTTPSTEAKQDTQITAEQAIQTAVQIMDDWDESDRAKVNPIVGQAGVDGNSGNKSDKTIRIVIATDQPALTNALQVKSTQKPSIGATSVMTVTNLQSIANSATAGWQSDKVSNLSTLATDYEIFVKLTTANTAPANDKAAYVWICPFYTTDAGTTWFAASGGTATLPSGSQGTYTIAQPHNLRLLGVLNYTTQQMVLQDVFLLSNCFGARLPDGFSIIITNFTGAALSTGCVVDYSPINDILV